LDAAGLPLDGGDEILEDLRQKLRDIENDLDPEPKDADMSSAEVSESSRDNDPETEPQSFKKWTATHVRDMEFENIPISLELALIRDIAAYKDYLKDGKYKNEKFSETLKNFQKQLTELAISHRKKFDYVPYENSEKKAFRTWTHDEFERAQSSSLMAQFDCGDHYDEHYGFRRFAQGYEWYVETETRQRDYLAFVALRENLPELERRELNGEVLGIT